MPTPEQYNIAFERERQGILDAIEKAKEANEAALASIARGKKRIKKLRRKGTRKGTRKGSRRRGRRSRKH
jgi:hypothetical protein